MADITMCRDTDCPMRKKCYRYTAKACEYRQSYFVNSPREGKTCKYFDDNKGWTPPKEDLCEK